MTDSATPAEGVIQFAYDLQTPDTAPLPEQTFATLNGWRSVLRELGLLGQTSERYGGLGFGNLSVRDTAHPAEFVITASQTSGEDRLSQDDLVRVTHCNLGRFWVDALGTRPPSSETITHAMIYAADPEIGWIFHCHSPEIWQRAEALALPCTPDNVGYGSPAMTAAVAHVLRRHPTRPLLFVTLGHEDGVFACAASAKDAGSLLVSTLAAARS